MSESEFDENYPEFFNEIARKETVRGKLRPSAAEARVYAIEGGTISNVLVQEGDLIEVGTPLVEVTSERVLTGGGRLSADALEALERERKTLKDRLIYLDQSALIAETDLEQRLGATRQAEADNRTLLDLQQTRLASALEQRDRMQPFFEDGTIAANEYYSVRDAAARQQESVLVTQRQINEAVATQDRLVTERRRIQTDLVRDKAGIRQRIAQLDAQTRRTEAEAGHRLNAPITGQVTALQARSGERADPSIPLLTITPSGTELIAELYLPSRAIAFVEPGQEVKLQYDALPYQKFGIATGSIASVSSTTLLPQELGVLAPIPEPFYRVLVRLDAQTVRAFQRDIPLQSGMELSADIVLENRKLLEWLLEPLLSVR